MGSDFEKRVSQDISYFERLSEIEKNYSLNRIYHLHSTLNLNKYSSVEIKKYWEKLVEDIKSRKKHGIIDFYIHIPFCKQKCLYCNYYSKKPSTEKEVEDYVEHLIKNMQFFSSTFKGIKFSTLYIGGGTPSILSYSQLKNFLSKLFSFFDFKEDASLTFEFNPTSISPKKLELIKKFKFNRLSFGVQTFDKKILSKMNRACTPYSSIKKIVDYARKLGFKNIDTDLIIDLKGQKPSVFLDSFQKAAKLGLSEIEVFPLIPTKRYLDECYNGDSKKFYQERSKILPEVARHINSMAEKFGYNTSELSPFDTTWGFSKKEYLASKKKMNTDEDDTMFQRYKKNKSGLNPDIFSFMGLGPSAISHIYSHLSYTNLCEGYSGKFDPESKACIGTPLSAEEEMSRYIIGSIIRSSKVSLKFFRERFDSEIEENFSYAIKALQMLGKAKIDNDALYFLPTDQKERFVYAMFFLSKDYLRLLESVNT